MQLPSQEQLASVDATAGTFILIRNLPEGVRLSDGIPVDRNWVISLNQARSVELLVPTQQKTTFHLQYLLIGPGNRILAETSSFVRLPGSEPPQEDETAKAPPTTATSVETTAATPETQPVAPSDLSLEEEALLLSRATSLMRQGSISGARLIFEELAERGSANGALALAQSFDPGYIGISPTSAIKPDVKQAVFWYERAAHLGSDQAKLRLEKLKQEG